MTSLQALLFTSTGRIGRQSYWTIIAAIVAAGFVLSLVPFFGTILPLLLLWPFGCIVAKRLHDGNRGAWPVLVVVALSIAAAVVSLTATIFATQPASIVAAFALAGPALLLSGASAMSSLGLILVAGLARGNGGANRFGDPERDPVTIATLLRMESA